MFLLFIFLFIRAISIQFNYKMCQHNIHGYTAGWPKSDIHTWIYPWIAISTASLSNSPWHKKSVILTNDNPALYKKNAASNMRVKNAERSAYIYIHKLCIIIIIIIIYRLYYKLRIIRCNVYKAMQRTMTAVESGIIMYKLLITIY